MLHQNKKGVFLPLLSENLYLLQRKSKKKKHCIECIFVTWGEVYIFMFQRRFTKRNNIFQTIFQVNKEEFPFLFERILANLFFQETFVNLYFVEVLLFKVDWLVQKAVMK